MNKVELRHVILEDFPDYDVRLMYSSRVHNSTESANISRYGFYGRSYGISNKPMMLVKGIRKLSDASGVVKDGLKIKLDATCSVPATLLKPHYTVITNRSPKSPDLIVLGSKGLNDVYEFRVFVAHNLKQILCVYEYAPLGETHNEAPSIENYRNVFKSIDEFADKSEEFYPYSGNLFDRFVMLEYSKGMYEFQNRVLPDTSFVTEDKLVTGTKPVTPEQLYSCVRMLDSSDKEVREAAIISLASSDYSKCRNIIGYLLSKYHLDEVKKMKQKSSAVKWMAKMCDINRWSRYSLTSEEDFAKDYLEISSQGLLTYTDERRNVLHCTDRSFLLRNHDFVKKIPFLEYDLETANIVAMSL